MKNKKFLILIILMIFCIGITISSVSANEDNSILTVENEVNLENSQNSNISLNSKENNDIIGQSYEKEEYSKSNTDEILSGGMSAPTEELEYEVKKHEKNFKYIKVGKYKIKVYKDDDFDTQKQKVFKYLKKHIKKPHTYKVHGYKFKVSAKMYANILFYKKYGEDAGDINIFFKSKTNKIKTLKVPVYKTKKVAHYKWKYKYLLNGKSYYKNGIYHSKTITISDKWFNNGWKFDSYASAQNNQGGFNYYSVVKKKVKYYTSYDDISHYKKVKCKVYACGGHSSWKPYVVFRGINGKVNQLVDYTYYRI